MFVESKVTQQKPALIYRPMMMTYAIPTYPCTSNLNFTLPRARAIWLIVPIVSWSFRARRTLPPDFQVVEQDGRLNVTSLKEIPARTKFGPVIAKMLNEPADKQLPFSLEVQISVSLFYRFITISSPITFLLPVATKFRAKDIPGSLK